jgi:enamine deaminase RidA (YjgF/YER057c/UK114 family)
MPGIIEARLQELKIELPAPVAAVGKYLPHVVSGRLIFLSGQTPIESGVRTFIGKVGQEISVAEGQRAAAVCAINLLARLKMACGGDLDRVVRCVKVVGFVNATPDFGEHPSVINGASDLFIKVFGEKGRHARSAVGMGSLPFGAAVEVEAIFEVNAGF